MQPYEHSELDGYSLVELMIIVILVMIFSAFAIPKTTTVIANLELRGTASDFAGLTQLARITAVQKNATYSVLFNLTSGNGAYVDLNGNGSIDSDEPMIHVGGNANQGSGPGGMTGS